MEVAPNALSGRHRQRGTLRLLTYWAALDRTSDGPVSYAASVTDEVGLVAAPTGSVTYDDRTMTADEAVRADIGRFIDETQLGSGKPPARLPSYKTW